MAWSQRLRIEYPALCGLLGYAPLTQPSTVPILASDMTNPTRSYHAYKISHRLYGVVYRLDESTSFDQRLKFKTLREAKEAARAFQREQEELNQDA